MAQTTASFQTRARTIDHLGREQIADCPTAISELWKNSYDAYAKNVALHIFDGVIPIATLVDDGHGMTLDDVNSKWLTVGTESKLNTNHVPIADRNGITQERAKQGQKGIGRLSCAALGSLLLLISKKKGQPFVTCLLDWRLFENPFLFLHDIKLPIFESESRKELVSQLPDMFDKLMGNIWGDREDKARDARVTAAWESYHQQEINEGKDSTKEKIEKTIISECFDDRHFDTWSVWQGKSGQGTAMFIADINEDLKALLSNDNGSESEGSEQRARERLQQTLNGFAYPFSRENEPQITDFQTNVIAWNGSLQRSILDEVRNFDIYNFDQLEHIVEGNIDEQGCFKGNVKAFGDWHNNITIKPKARYKTRKDSRFGPFSIRLGTFEVLKQNTTLSDEQHEVFFNIREQRGGMMVFRDLLRVMPYGREDNDYFEIEKRRSKNAGMYVFSNRTCFGGVSITKENNPNLKDKAGREGIIDNRASKLFREVVEHILVEVAKRFLGRNSEIRKDKLEELNAIHNAKKNEQDRKKILRKEQRRIKKSITENTPLLTNTLTELQEITDILSNRISLDDKEELVKLKHQADEFNAKVKSYSLSPIPRSLGSLEKPYREYRDAELQAKQFVKQITISVNEALAHLTDKQDIDIAEKAFTSKAGVLHAKIRKLSTQGKALLKQEQQRFEEQVNAANKAYHQKLSDHLDDLAAKRTDLKYVLSRIDNEYELTDISIDQQLKPYITTLQSLSEQIDLEGIAISSLNETSKLKNKLEQINGLAQLGITVEIIGHEIEGVDMTIERGLRALLNSELTSHQKRLLASISEAHQSLSDSWRFLSPLKLSGEKIRKTITGNEIYNYVSNFFNDRLLSKNIKLIQTQSFAKFSIHEQPSRIFPVFINLINNARYWVKENSGNERQICLDFRNGLIYVSDNGPGVDKDDIEKLFTIFFTKKQRGGRGVGLYLCKQNLITGGHKIFYETREEKQVLNGANFVIEFKGAKDAK